MNLTDDAMAQVERLFRENVELRARIAAALEAIDRHDGADAQFSEHWKWAEVRKALTGEDGV